MKTCALEKQSSLSLHPLVPIPFLFLSESAYLKAYRNVVLGKKKKKESKEERKKKEGRKDGRKGGREKRGRKKERRIMIHD